MSPTYSILVIDDDPSVLDVLRRVMAQLFKEAQLIGVASFAQAVCHLEGLSGRGPDLILLDIGLRGDHSGLEVLAHLRAHPQGRCLPVVVLSGNDNPALLGAAYRQGASAYTLKPEGLADWKHYVAVLRAYWYQTTTAPRLWFEPKQPD